MTDIARRSHPAIETLRAQIAPKASDEELAYFGEVCRRLNLDPFAGHIVLVGRHDKRVGRDVHRPQLTVDGRRHIAEETGTYDGMDGPYWCGPRDADGKLEWREVWDDDDIYPYAARVLVYRTDRTHAANGTVKWSEFAQYNYNGQLLPLWKQMPSHMLGKTAESLALRRAFAQVAQAVAIVGEDLEQPTEPRQPAELAPPEFAQLHARLAEVRDDDPEWLASVRDWWRRNSRPPVGHPDFTAQHAVLLLEKLNNPVVHRHTDEPTPVDVIDSQPETVDEPAYRYDPEDGEPFA